MNILHIDPDDMDNPLSGGGPVRTFEICRRLARRHKVTVLTPTFPGSTPELIREGVRYIRLGRRIGNHGSSHHITFFFSLARAVRQFDYDLLVEDFMPPASVTLNPLLSKAPVVASVQWFFAEALSRQYHLPFHLGERHGLRMYRHFVVLSSKMRELVAARAPRADVEVIPNGIADERLFSLPIAGEGGFILYLGRVDMRQKGLDLLLRALARISAADRPRLMIAGHGFEQERVMALTEELGLTPSTVFVGRVNESQRLQVLRDCRFVCIPSREETFGMVITEACAAGKRVIAFDLPPMNEVAPAGACELVPAFDVDAYAHAIAGYQRCDAAVMVSEGKRCRDWARRYRWDDIADRQEALYRRVIDEASLRTSIRST